MGREGVRETGTAYVVFLFPDVCLTPMGPSMVPVPYPVVGVFDNVALVAPSVRMRGRPTFTTASQVTRVTGDEAGTGGGVKSGKNMAVCESVTASTTVRAEGHYILRHGDVMKMNNGNTLGTVVFMPGLGPVFVGAGVPSEDGFWDTAADAGKWVARHAKKIGIAAAKRAGSKIKSLAKSGLRHAVYGPYAWVEDVGNAYETLSPQGFWNAFVQPYVDAYDEGGVDGVIGTAGVDAAEFWLLSKLGGPEADETAAAEESTAAERAQGGGGGSSAAPNGPGEPPASPPPAGTGKDGLTVKGRVLTQEELAQIKGTSPEWPPEYAKLWRDLGPPRGAGDPPWKFNPEVDVDMRGQSQGLLTLEKALDEAFRRTGVPREQFTPTRWAKDRFGKTHAVEWEVLEGENQGTQVNVDNPRVAPSNYGPVDPHVGYEVPGKRSRGEGKRGHIILNEVPATR